MENSSRTLIVLVILAPFLVPAQPPVDDDYAIGVVEMDGEEVMFVQGELLIKPMPDVDASDFAVELDAKVIDSIPRIGWYRLKLPSDVDAAAVYNEMQDSPHLASCDLNGVIPFEEEIPGNDSSNRITCPPENEIQWPLTITGAVDAWDEVPSSSDVIIAILDSGCDTDHPEYATSPRIHYGRDWTNKNYPGWPEDYNGHGTLRVGEVMAPADGFGIAGINQNCHVHVEKIMDSLGHWQLWAMARALDHVVFEEYCRVVSISVYRAEPSYHGMKPLREAMIDVNNNGQWAVVLCCAGNDDWVEPIHYPAAWSCSLECVMAVGASTEFDGIWAWNQYLPGDWGGQLSFLSPGDHDSYCSTALGGGWNYEAGGTSGATAFAAGIAGMMISKFPWITRDEIRSRLQNSADRIDVPECDWHVDDVNCWGDLCWCLQAGSGRLDALACLSPIVPLPRCISRDSGQEFFSPEGHDLNSDYGAITVYDLLGRRLCSLPLQDVPGDRNAIVSYVMKRKSLPNGAKIIRIVTEKEVQTWRLVP